KLSALSPRAHFSKVLKTIKNKSSLIQGVSNFRENALRRWCVHLCEQEMFL
ncbi:hypothetical protein LEMLEM_LOCUS8780, partial [Lemmus lemmus]